MTRFNLGSWLPDAFMVSGAAAISLGAGLIYLPAGLIVGGLLLLLGGYLLAKVA